MGATGYFDIPQESQARYPMPVGVVEAGRHHATPFGMRPKDPA
jgi:hypothetical protein